MSIFVYQLAYWGWVKLEKDEIKKERKGTVYGAPRGQYHRGKADESIQQRSRDWRSNWGS